MSESGSIEWTDQHGRRHVRTETPPPRVEELKAQLMATHLKYPTEMIRRADAVIVKALAVGDDQRECLSVLIDELQRDDVPGALELATAIVAIQRLAFKYSMEVAR